jgi:hypothetical protein
VSDLLATVKLLGVLGLSEADKAALVYAYALEKIYGYAYSRRPQLRARFRHLAQITLAKRRAGRSPVYDLEPLGRDIVLAMNVPMTFGNPDNVPEWVIREGEF